SRFPVGGVPYHPHGFFVTTSAYTSKYFNILNGPIGIYHKHHKHRSLNAHPSCLGRVFKVALQVLVPPFHSSRRRWHGFHHIKDLIGFFFHWSFSDDYF